MLPTLFPAGTLVPGSGLQPGELDSSSPFLLLQKWPSSNTNLTRLLPATVHPASTLCPPHLFQLPGSALSKLVYEFPPALVKFHPLKGACPNCPVIPNNINTFYFSAQNIIPADLISSHQNIRRGSSLAALSTTYNGAQHTVGTQCMLNRWTR